MCVLAASIIFNAVKRQHPLEAIAQTAIADVHIAQIDSRRCPREEESPSQRLRPGKRAGAMQLVSEQVAG